MAKRTHGHQARNGKGLRGGKAIGEDGVGPRARAESEEEDGDQGTNESSKSLSLLSVCDDSCFQESCPLCGTSPKRAIVALPRILIAPDGLDLPDEEI